MSESKELPTFEKEISRLPKEMQDKLLEKKQKVEKLQAKVNEIVKEKSIGFYITPEVQTNEQGMPVPNFDKMAFYFLLDDFEKPIFEFNPRMLLQDEFDNFLIEERKVDEFGQQYFEYFLKEDKSIEFVGHSVHMLRENCFDSSYDDLKALGGSFIIQDNRGFIGALKTIDIHRNMLLQKFEKYIVVYAGAGSWLRGEKSNDFDVFVVVDDTDVKKMPRAQVKDQLTRLIWQMSHEVAALTGIQVHIQVYLLTDFWDALKDAHPVMFTFLRDGVPFYDRGLYNSWKELLKLGKIRPSPEAIDMHMNVGTQLIDRAKKIFNDIVINDIYNAVLSPSQAILMLKGYNPTTPKETVKMFKEVLYAKEKCVTKKDADILENTVGLFKKIEHDKDFVVTGKDVDKLIKDSEKYLQNIKKMFEEISENRTKESIVSTYSELLNQIRSLPGYLEVKEDKLIDLFLKEYVDSGKMPSFVKKSVKNVLKTKADYDAGKVTVTEVNKVLKEARNVFSEIKSLRESSMIDELSNKKVVLTLDESKTAEVLNFDSAVYLIDNSSNEIYKFDDKNSTFDKFDGSRDDFLDVAKLSQISINENLIKAIKETLKSKELFL